MDSPTSSIFACGFEKVAIFAFYKKRNSMVELGLLRDPPLAAPRMRPGIVFYVFHESSQKFMEVAKTKNPIRYARFARLRDHPLAAARMHPVFVFYVFHESLQKFVEVAKA